MIYKAAAVFLPVENEFFLPTGTNCCSQGLPNGCGFPLAYLLYTDA